VSSPVYRVTKLAPGFDLGAFDCGESAYNEWLVQHAVNAVGAGSSMVYLLLERVHPGAEERVSGPSSSGWEAGLGGRPVSKRVRRRGGRQPPAQRRRH